MKALSNTRAAAAASGFSQQAKLFLAGRSPSERRALGAAALVVTLALVWWVALSPALTTLAGSESQRRELDAQLQTMQALAVQAASLQSLPRIRGAESLSALEASVRQLGAAAQMTVAGERANVTLKGVSADALSTWLLQARSNARVVPLEARLRMNAARSGWDGSVVFTLPPS